MRKTNCPVSSKVKWNCFCRSACFNSASQTSFVLLLLRNLYEFGGSPSSRPVRHSLAVMSLQNHLCILYHSFFLGAMIRLCISVLSDRLHLNIFRASFLPVINSVSAGDNILSLLSAICLVSRFLSWWILLTQKEGY